MSSSFTNRRAPITFLVFLLAMLFLSQAKVAHAFPWRAYYIASGSMENTFKAGDRLLADNGAYRKRSPQNGEIVVFKAPAEALWNSSDPEREVNFLMRVVGTAGQKVEIVRGQLFVNGKKVDEPYKKPLGKSLVEPTDVYDMKIIDGVVYSRDYITQTESGPWMQNSLMVPQADQHDITQMKTGTVPAGRLLVLGDNRGNSNDSHVWGFLPIDSLRGRVLFRYWPLTQFKLFSLPAE